MEDSQIIELYFERSQEAIHETDRKYGAYLKTLVRRILRSREDMEEVLNDTYMGAWNTMPPTRPRQLRHFLSRIARNLSFDRLDHRTAKKRCPGAEILLSELEDCIPDKRSDVETIWEAKEIGRSLNRFLESLEETECAIFVLRYYYASPVKEIAAKYQMSERRVKYLLSNMRTQLKNHLEKDGVIL